MKWYFTWHRPNMKALGGAFWPVMAIKVKDDIKTIKHEETHMIGQLLMLLLPWIVLYGMFHLLYGYNNNPFERWATAVENGTKFHPYGFINYL